MTRLCVAIFVDTPEQAKHDIAMAVEAGADMVELRIDLLNEPVFATEFIIPVILTCRPTWEGGRSGLGDEARIALLESAGYPGGAYVHVELITYRRVPNVRTLIPRQLILSAHDFHGRPDRLHNLVLEMNESGGSVNKLVWTARTVRD